METPLRDNRQPAGLSRSGARWVVRGLQLCFILVAILNLNGPLLTVHNERQNQTYDVARHVFQEGWSGVLNPKASFSLAGYEARPFTISRQEFPFHGLLGWPFVQLFGHELAVVRLVSIFFALLSIEFIYLILQLWLDSITAVVGTALWALSPLLLQFGQVPMPDILCTTGMLAAFYYALKSSVSASSGWFLFAILGKISVIVFGLPILTALLLAKNCRSIGEFFWIAVVWGAVPLLGLLGWISLEIMHPDTPWTIVKMITEHSGTVHLFALSTYALLLLCLIPYGVGLLGVWGCFVIITGKSVLPIKPIIPLTLLAANLLYLLFIYAKVPEPQYVLPPLAWLTVAAAFGLQRVITGPFNFRKKIILTMVVGLQASTTLVFTHDLKASHVPNYDKIENAARLIPPNSHVIVAYPFYGASPAVWLNQNVFAVHYTNELNIAWPQLQKAGFDYLLIMDVKSHSARAGHVGLAGLAKMGLNLFPLRAATSADDDVGFTDFANPGSPFRLFCDGRFEKIFSDTHVILYSLNPPRTSAQ